MKDGKMTKRAIGGALLATPESNPAHTEQPAAAQHDR
jgi:hypothetical protein